MEDLFHIPMRSAGAERQKSLTPGRTSPTKGMACQKFSENRPEEDDWLRDLYQRNDGNEQSGDADSQEPGVERRHLDGCVYQGQAQVQDSFHLPVSHVYEFTIGQLLVLLCGCEIVYLGRPPAPSSLLPALKEVRPHAIMTVPLLIEKIYRSSVLPMLKKNTKLQRYLRFGITRRFICRIIGRKINVTMGGRVRFYGIGGAPLDREVEEFLAEANFHTPSATATETSPDRRRKPRIIRSG